MQPHSLSTVRMVRQAPMPSARLQTGADTTVPHSPRRKVADFPDGFLKQRHIEALEHNQKISSCCRHPENHDVEALKSHPDEGAPDIYIFHCTCGRSHRFFCVGMEDERPEWR